MRLSTQRRQVGCVRLSSRYCDSSSNVFAPVEGNSCRRVQVTILYALIARTHDLPLSMPVKPPNAALISTSTPDHFISEPMQPQNDCTMCIAPGRRTICRKRSGSDHLIRCATWYNCISMDRYAYDIPKSVSDFCMYTSEVSTVSG